MVFQEMQDSLDHKVHLDLRGLEEIKVHKVNKEHKEQKVTQVHKDLEELMAMLDLLEHEETLVLKELQVINRLHVSDSVLGSSQFKIVT